MAIGEGQSAGNYQSFAGPLTFSSLRGASSSAACLAGSS